MTYSEAMIRGVMPPHSRSLLTELMLVDEVDSTNSALKRVELESRQSGLCMIANQQTAGRGRHGRRWMSAPGCCLMMSLYWQFDQPIEQLSALPLAVAVAISRSLSDLGMNRHRLKWPNDILVDGRKLAGILVETDQMQANRCSVICGVGLNLQQPPDIHQQIGRPMVDLVDCLPDNSADRNRIAGLLLGHLCLLMNEIAQMGFSSILDEWRQRDALAGKAVISHSRLERISGRASGIDEQGMLLVATEQGMQHLASGEVSLSPNG